MYNVHVCCNLLLKEYYRLVSVQISVNPCSVNSVLNIGTMQFFEGFGQHLQCQYGGSYQLPRRLSRKTCWHFVLQIKIYSDEYNNVMSTAIDGDPHSLSNPSLSFSLSPRPIDLLSLTITFSALKASFLLTEYAFLASPYKILSKYLIYVADL